MGKASVLGFGSLLGVQQIGNHAAQGTESRVIETQERNHQDGGKVMALADHDDCLLYTSKALPRIFIPACSEERWPIPSPLLRK